jgi:hypothetical protein
MELTKYELEQLEAIREVLRERIVDTMVLKNQLIWILTTLARLMEQSTRKD